ncbi:MAG: BBE domain-containing protein [Actinobacteria bacterium]|nr:BBE domain-containing protein [Actinomycetota bacterium]
MGGRAIAPQRRDLVRLPATRGPRLGLLGRRLRRSFRGRQCCLSGDGQGGRGLNRGEWRPVCRRRDRRRAPPRPGDHVNFQLAEDDVARTADAYGNNYERLQRLKLEYDPGNLFRVNRNISPAP